ncbi:MAG: hypothetical protein QF451_12245 [Nitrospinota bacterium]|nr:hypothetical protein [Nitrospinota bacterium]
MALKAVEVVLEVSFRFSAILMGLAGMLLGGWGKGRVIRWLQRLELSAASSHIAALESRIGRLERERARGVRRLGEARGGQRSPDDA